MTKLEEKLQELEYEIYFSEHKYINTCAIKEVNGYDITIFINKSITKIDDYEITLDSVFSIKDQSDVDYIQEALDVMKKDLEVLKQCQD